MQQSYVNFYYEIQLQNKEPWAPPLTLFPSLISTLHLCQGFQPFTLLQQAFFFFFLQWRENTHLLIHFSLCFSGEEVFTAQQIYSLLTLSFFFYGLRNLRKKVMMLCSISWFLFLVKQHIFCLNSPPHPQGKHPAPVLGKSGGPMVPSPGQASLFNSEVKIRKSSMAAHLYHIFPLNFNLL